MTVTNTLIQKLKKQAREEGRNSSLSHSQLLEKYARELGFQNWKDLLPHPDEKTPDTDILLPEFRDRLLDPDTRRNFKQSMVIDRDGRLSVCYAAFENINRSAKVVLVGLTPGEQQALRANEAVAERLASGGSDEEALEAAKVFASFSGPMRSNLVALLDGIGLHDKLGIDSTNQLFGERSDLCHFTSALRYPVFIDGKNYSGSPSLLSHPLLRTMIDEHLTPELSAMSKEAWFIPLGKESALALGYLATKGIISRERVLNGLPHPSGANAERIAYFLGRKERETLSAKTNADSLDEAKVDLLRKITRDRIMDRKPTSTDSSSTIETGRLPVSSKRVSSDTGPASKVMPARLENEIIELAQRTNMMAIHGTGARHELELRFTNTGREESIYINRKAYWGKQKLKIALRPELSDRVSDVILSSNCAVPLIQKGEQREAYSSNYRAFSNRRYAKGSKNEHFGHAWLVNIDDGMTELSQFFEILSTSK